MTSSSCASCHSAIYAEHRQGAHGKAFLDPETRLATRNFRREDCIRCHVPRPIFETGSGMTPMLRWTDFEEGNTCMTCHWKQDYDYSRFVGGKECKLAFDPRAGTVQACASCHRIAGTPDQWSRAEHGAKAGNVCIDCHMPLVNRPVAVGEPSRPVRSHVYPAAHSESQLRRAYAYDAKIEGDQVIVRIENKGTGHNFPTANRQRAVESLITVRDAEGKEIGSSRLVCRYPYASELEPGQLTMPVGTQIPSGQTREHHVPIPIGAGTVECSLFFKLYRPIDDFDPQLSRRLEYRILPFAGVTPSQAEIEDAPKTGSSGPPVPLDDFFRVDGFGNVARPAPSSEPIAIPDGKNEQEIDRLISLLEFHMPEARRLARERLRSLGPVAYRALIRALGSWSNETFNQVIEILASIGEPAVPDLLAATDSPELYVRCHARAVLARISSPQHRRMLVTGLERDLQRPQPLDRRSAAAALGAIGDPQAVEAFRPLLLDADWDVVSAAALALAQLGDRASEAAMTDALHAATFIETRRDLALALAQLGSAAGVPVLLDGLDQPDEWTRSSFFDGLFAATGMHFGYDPAAPRIERLESIARMQACWAEAKDGERLRKPRRIAADLHERALQLVLELGGGTDTVAGGDDVQILDELVRLGSGAVPALIEGLTFPSGYPSKRALACEALGRIADKDAAPYLAAALRDPVLSVCERACWALEAVRDPAVQPALSRFQNRVLRLRADQASSDIADRLRARVARTSLMLGDDRQRDELVSLLLSNDRETRDLAIRALEERYGDRRGYDPDASEAERAAGAQRWID